MHYLIFVFSAFFLSSTVLAGPETINLHIDTSYCSGNIQWREKHCEQIDHISGQNQKCYFLPSPQNELFLTLQGESVVEISGVCNGFIRSCVYQFRPSLVRNARYPSEVVTAFPNGITLNTTLIRDQLTYLKVECE